eukprot:jgi/Chlat1/5579/Chrsp369S00854
MAFTASSVGHALLVLKPSTGRRQRGSQVRLTNDTASPSGSRRWQQHSGRTAAATGDEAANTPTAPDTTDNDEEEEERLKRTNASTWSSTSGSDASQAAEDKYFIDKRNMRPEEIVMAETMRPRQVEIITKDGMYKPTVSTWGVFPRPRDISEAYGGGRTIRPGEALETDDRATKRAREVAAALKKYKKSVGEDMEPDAIAEVEQMLAHGVDLFDKGKLREAEAVFKDASGKCAARHRLGGEAELQRALALDSMGLSDQAQAIYKKLQEHPNMNIKKRAQRFLFGFSAAENLKVTKEYSWDKEYYDTIFVRFADNYRRYIPKPGDDEAAGTDGLTIAIVAALFVFPFALVAVLAFANRT